MLNANAYKDVRAFRSQAAPGAHIRLTWTGNTRIRILSMSLGRVRISQSFSCESENSNVPTRITVIPDRIALRPTDFTFYLGVSDTTNTTLVWL